MSSSPVRSGPARLRLYDALQVLTSPEGREIVARVKKDTYSLAMDREQDPLPYLNADTKNPQGPDSFRVQIMEHVYDEHYEVSVDRALPIAVVRALAEAADSSGVVNLSEVGAKLGPYAAQVAFELDRSLQTFKPHELPINTKYETADTALISKIAGSKRRSYGRSRMPLLPETTKLFGGANHLAEWKMASLGHLFATRPALYRELESNGLPRSAHLISGKGYSRSVDAVASMRAEGRRVDESLLEAQGHYDKSSAHDDLRAITTLRQLFDGVTPGGADKFLLLDDGGNLAVALHKHFPEYAKQCRIVEQTDHGIQRIEREIGVENLKCSVINVARSWLKKVFESPIIGEAVMHSIDTLLAEVHPKLGYVRKEAAMLGFGAVNQAVAKAMERRGFAPKDIWVWDRDPARRAEALRLGYRVSEKENEAEARLEVLAHGYLTVTATGQQTLSPSELDRLPPGAIMANAGSGNHELGMGEVEAKQRWVAPVGGERYYRRMTPVQEEGPAQVDAFMATALEHLAFRDAIDPVPAPKTAAILGYDEGGKRAIERLLEAGFERDAIKAVDSNPERMAAAQKAGFSGATRDEAIIGATVLVSNLERPVSTSEELAMRPPGGLQVTHGAMPMDLGPDEEARAAASGLHLPELRDTGLRRDEEFFRGYVVNNGVTRAGEQYRHRVLRSGKGDEVLVLRSGYVVNMETGIPPEYVQLILSMLLAGCLQATTADKPGLHELEHQDVLLARFERQLEKLGRSLSAPSFAGLRPADG